MVCSPASASTRRPRSVAVLDVTGPIETTSGCGSGMPPTTVDEVRDGRRRRERERVDGTAADAVERVGIGRRDHGSVDPEHVDLVPPRRQPGGQHVARLLGPGEEHPLARRPRVGERLEQRLGHEPRRHEVGTDAPRRECIGRSRPDGRDRRAREGAGIEAGGAEPAVEERVHAVDRREHHPAVVGERRDRERDRLDRDRRQLDDGGAERLEPAAQLARLLPRPA